MKKIYIFAIATILSLSALVFALDNVASDKELNTNELVLGSESDLVPNPAVGTIDINHGVDWRYPIIATLPKGTCQVTITGTNIGLGSGNTFTVTEYDANHNSRNLQTCVFERMQNATISTTNQLVCKKTVQMDNRFFMLWLNSVDNNQGMPTLYQLAYSCS